MPRTSQWKALHLPIVRATHKTAMDMCIFATAEAMPIQKANRIVCRIFNCLLDKQWKAVPRQQIAIALDCKRLCLRLQPSPLQSAKAESVNLRSAVVPELVQAKQAPWREQKAMDWPQVSPHSGVAREREQVRRAEWRK